MSYAQLSISLIHTIFINFKKTADDYNIRITNVSHNVKSKFATVDYNLFDGREANVTCKLFGTVTKALVEAELFVMPLDGSSPYHSCMKKSVEICNFLAYPWTEPLAYILWKEVSKDYRHKIAFECPVQPVRFIYFP